MGRLEAMEMFVAVADRGGFAAAARALRTSPPAVTRGIAALEMQLGVTLFHRSTRAVSLTSEGAGFLARARHLLAEHSEAERELQGAHSQPRGQLYVTAPVCFGQRHVLPVIMSLLADHSELIARMMLIDRNVQIIEEGIDVAVRIGPLVDSTLKAVRIGDVRQVLVASPDYLKRHHTLMSPVDLGSHNLIGTTGPRAVGEWRFDRKGATKIKIKPRLLINTVDGAIAAAEAGVGIANLLSYQIDDALNAGRLVEVLHQTTHERLPVHLLFEASRSTLPAVRAFINAMQQRTQALCNRAQNT